jgi:predicted GNAT family acetyltransferase
MAMDADHVVLFTDLANPVSNAIYQRIGFEPVSDWRTIALSAGTAGRVP